MTSRNVGEFTSDMQQLSTYHAIIGIVTFSLLWAQAVWGYVAHSFYKTYQHRTWLAYGHVWLGRTLITVGMIQGGLGLLLADDAGPAYYKAYGIVAGIIWFAYMSFSIWSDVNKPVRSRPAKTIV